MSDSRDLSSWLTSKDKQLKWVINLRSDELTISDLIMICNERLKLALIKAYTQHKPPQMGEEESGDLKTPLKKRSFIKLYNVP